MIKDTYTVSLFWLTKFTYATNHVDKCISFSKILILKISYKKPYSFYYLLAKLNTKRSFDCISVKKSVTLRFCGFFSIA